MKIVCDIFLYTFDTHGYTYFVVFTVAILLIAYLVVMLWLQNREKALLTRSLALTRRKKVSMRLLRSMR